MNRELDPGVLRPEAGRPDDRLRFENAAVLEPDRLAFGGDQPRVKLDPASLRVLGAGSHERVAVSEALAQPRIDGLRKYPELVEPPEEVAAEYPLRQRLLPRANGEVNS